MWRFIRGQTRDKIPRGTPAEVGNYVLIRNVFAQEVSTRHPTAREECV
jgi:hypothetical protein